MFSALLLLLTAPSAPGALAAWGQPAGPLDEPTRILSPQRPRTDEDAIRVAAAAYYAHGRLLLERGDFAGALRRLQRAWRYDPQAVFVLPQIVFLAHRLNRSDETARYALVAAERTEIPYPLLLRLAGWLNDQRNWKGAIRLYEKALVQRQQLSPNARQADVGGVLLHYELGRLYFLVKQFPQSAEHFATVRDALENPQQLSQNASLQKLLVGEANRTYRLVAESFLQAGRCDEAEAMFEEANPTEKDRAMLAFQRARVAEKRGKLDQALRHLDAYFNARSDAAGTEPYQLLADLLPRVRRGKKKAEKELLARLEALHEADPDNDSLAYSLAQTLRRNRRWDRAGELLRALADQEPSGEVYDSLIDVYHHQKRFDRLLDTLGEAIAQAGSLDAIGPAAEKLPDDRNATDELIAAARRRLSQDGQQSGAGLPLAAAWLALAAERVDEAAELFDAALQASEASAKTQILLRWGLELLLAGQHQRAAAVFRRTLAEDLAGDRKDACSFYLIRALALSEKNDEALRVARQAAADFHDSPRLRAQPAWIAYYAKRYQDAEKQYLAFLDAFDDRYDDDATRDQVRDARLILSNICVQLDRTAEAEEWLEQVLDEFPGDIGALNDLGYLWTEQGKNLNRALAMIRRAVEADPDNTAYLDSLGWVHYQLGNYQQAVEQLQKAVSSAEQPDGVILDHLGDAYLRVNRTEEAIRTWRQAAESFGKSDDDSRRKATLEKIKKHEKK